MERGIDRGAAAVVDVHEHAHLVAGTAGHGDLTRRRDHAVGDRPRRRGERAPVHVGVEQHLVVPRAEAGRGGDVAATGEGPVRADTAHFSPVPQYVVTWNGSFASAPVLWLKVWMKSDLVVPALSATVAIAGADTAHRRPGWRGGGCAYLAQRIATAPTRYKTNPRSSCRTVFVGIGPGRAARLPENPHMHQPPQAATQAIADLAQRIGVSQLTEQHGDELRPASKALGGTLSGVLLYECGKLSSGKVLEQLIE